MAPSKINTKEHALSKPLNRILHKTLSSREEYKSLKQQELFEIFMAGLRAVGVDGVPELAPGLDLARLTELQQARLRQFREDYKTQLHWRWRRGIESPRLEVPRWQHGPISGRTLSAKSCSSPSTSRSSSSSIANSCSTSP